MTAQATAQAVAEKLEVEMKEFRALRDGSQSRLSFGTASPPYVGNAVSLRYTETAKLANARNTVVTQLQENEMVKKVRLTFFRITEQLQLGY